MRKDILRLTNVKVNARVVKRRGEHYVRQKWHLSDFFFQFLVPGLTLASLLESQLVFEIVAQLADTGNDRLRVYSLSSMWANV